MFEHNPQQFHGWNQMGSLVWSGHEFEEQLVEVMDFRKKFIVRLIGIYGIYLKLLKKNPKITTFNNWLNLETLGACNYAQTSPRTLFETSLELAELAFVWIWLRRHNTLYCITDYCDQCKANMLLFMPVLYMGLVFSFLDRVRKNHAYVLNLFPTIANFHHG